MAEYLDIVGHDELRKAPPGKHDSGDYGAASKILMSLRPLSYIVRG
jgi:hypothetical protein